MSEDINEEIRALAGEIVGVLSGRRADVCLSALCYVSALAIEESRDRGSYDSFLRVLASEVKRIALLPAPPDAVQ
jgi:hypothetical protein